MQSILEKFVRHIDNFSIRKNRFLSTYSVCFANHVDRRGDHIYGSAYRSTAAQI